MAYIINKYNGDQAAVVEDGTINTTLDIKLVGKNYAGYGEAQNENYTWLLENFASQTAPPKAVVGQLWYQTSTQKLKVNYGTNTWHTVGINDVVPTIADVVGLTQGDLFWVSDEQQLWCKGATENILIGGKLTNISTQMRSSTVRATDNSLHEIIEAVVNSVTTYVISSEGTYFELAITEPLKSAGFARIYPGITINGFSESTKSSDPYKYWGSSSNAERLGGIIAANYVTNSSAVFTAIAKFTETGFSVGPSDSEILFISTPDDVPTISNGESDTIIFKTKDSGNIKIPMKLVGQDIIPGTPYATSTGSNIGSSTYQFYQVWATAFKGNADTASAIKFSGTTYTAAVEATSATVALRSAAPEIITFNGADYTLPAGSIKATQVRATTFVGNATSATGLVLGSDTVTPLASGYTENTVVVRTKADETISGHVLEKGSIKVKALMTNGSTVTYFGDIAEKYLADAIYDVGTVIMIGGENEVTAAVAGNRALGVVSDKPALLMNVGLEAGTAVALKGRVPVKVTGTVKKGDRLVASAEAGFAKALSASKESEFVFAISLTNSNDNQVEAVII